MVLPCLKSDIQRHLMSNNGTMSEDVLQSWYIIIIYTKVNKEIILNRDLCGVFRELKAKKTYNYWSVEENKWKMVFRSTTDDGESRWSAEHLDGILFYTSTNFCWCREPLICRTLMFGTLIFVRLICRYADPNDFLFGTFLCFFS